MKLINSKKKQIKSLSEKAEIITLNMTIPHLSFFFYFGLLLLLSLSCSHFSARTDMKLELFIFPQRMHGKVLKEGFSGLYFAGKNDNGDLVFWSHSDRGPNTEPIKDPVKNTILRPFVDPTFQPRLYQFVLNRKTGSIEFKQDVPLTMPNGEKMNGLPNFKARAGRTGDETPVQLDMTALPFDPMGVDPESLCFIQDDIWMAEEYGPSLLKFNLQGRLLERHVPKGYFTQAQISEFHEEYGVTFIKETLPTKLMGRKLNRGFEGMANRGHFLYVSMQSPLPSDGKNVMILEFEVRKGLLMRKLFYPLDTRDADKIGDLTFMDEKLLVLEQNSETGPNSFHKVFAVDLSESKEDSLLAKELLVDLVNVGLDFTEKIEGLAIVEKNELAVINDNDFGLEGSIGAIHGPTINASKKSVLAIIQLE